MLGWKKKRCTSSDHWKSVKQRQTVENTLRSIEWLRNGGRNLEMGLPVMVISVILNANRWWNGWSSRRTERYENGVRLSCVLHFWKIWARHIFTFYVVQNRTGRSWWQHRPRLPTKRFVNIANRTDGYTVATAPACLHKCPPPPTTMIVVIAGFRTYINT